ncbi:MAG TPA: carboxyl transferase domain-containing protein, partial [Chthoniobacteraceae bacterium]|nr:carboxyl transferase domain-containing protein [Chthoniobacteraceae bacterium]
RPAAVVWLFDCGGVRLQEANAGEMAVSEAIRALMACRSAGVPVLALVAGANGAFGGAGILSLCCDRVIASESVRLGVSGPEVIETVMGAEAFDSRDRALVWRTVGGKNRYLYGEVDTLVEDRAAHWREAALAALKAIETGPLRWSLEGLRAESEALARRVEQYGDAGDALEIWKRMGLENPEAIPLMEVPELVAAAKAKGVR